MASREDGEHCPVVKLSHQDIEILHHEFKDKLLGLRRCPVILDLEGVAEVARPRWPEWLFGHRGIALAERIKECFSPSLKRTALPE
ncbi:hypothetical protein A3A14_02455 [Candidatus Daviesbacteria bacterium RIFCSPLOWO2_01_FULL_43_38]|uniref:Uncharacterized protein n=3 Tax=Candidatus Daviesiibacteriota TaxID=1752718 RepID=A0A1F5K1F5_9BACT|nr:MAG: hypothetical protein UV33_C0013G0012 [Candidatus Daviesbacteria bacterium GW2011_GWA1_42_6]KKS69623.1 MAG: hypothetical protein UV41_C0049G0005 [Candidatus Daviesbacteria bacterium GW2011_GWA2_42_7]OGE19109.1 MAG: hypothetical protein A2874_01860 [Candidatus Daviesbacteria bacterium RIFCSPHIGHO2_01_FULL_43_17]OGE34817.1 MAG: hypothetical protein A3E45_02475 [Candidatus Daviesbacteria bacterium RIFCSPHIGHO2_12_FULL_43_11]OGE64026.1 MAG: hypothetical protein A3A14_02455 [Candidatus Davies